LILLLFVLLVFAGCNSPSRVHTSTQNQKQNACYQQFGITLSGAEGTGADYSRPTNDELSYYASKGVKLIRLEVRWDKLQPELGGPLNKDELQWVETFVTQANHLKMQVDIDLHQRSNYNDLNFGDGDINPSTLADFWKKFAESLVHDRVSGICGFGIANEPDNKEVVYDLWPNQVNRVVGAIRQVDTFHFVFVGEDRWDSSLGWRPKQAELIRDPAGKIVFEAHSYWDEGASGNYQPDIPPPNTDAAKNLVTRSLSPFIQWCRQTHNRCFVGEFGVPPDKGWLEGLDFAFQYMKQNNVFGCYWAGGPGYSDIVSIEPVDRKDSAQIRVLEKYLV